MNRYSVVKYAVLNVFRMKNRSLRLFAVLFVSAVLLLTAWMVADLCDRLIAASLGPLNGTFGVLTADEPDAAFVARLEEGFGSVEQTVARATHPAYLYVGDAEIRGVKRTTGEKAVVFPEIDGYYHASPFHMHAISDTATEPAFFSGTVNIVAGRGISRQDSDENALAVVISAAVADLHGLSVGDRLGLRTATRTQRAGMTSRPRLHVEIVGLYETSAENRSAVWDYEVSQNTFYIPFGTANYFVSRQNAEKGDGENVFLPVAELYVRLRNEQAAPLLTRRLSDIFMTQTRLLRHSADTQARLLFSMLQTTYMLVAVLVVVTSGLVMLLSWQTRRERALETGVLQALGVKNSTISGQAMLEILLLAAIGLAAATAFAAAISLALQGMVGDWLLHNEQISTLANTTDVSAFAAPSPAAQAAMRPKGSLLSLAHVGKTGGIFLAAVMAGGAAASMAIAKSAPIVLLSRGDV